MKTYDLDATQLNALLQSAADFFKSADPRLMPSTLQDLGADAFIACRHIEQGLRPIREQFSSQTGKEFNVDLPLRQTLQTHSEFLAAVSEWGELVPDALDAATRWTAAVVELVEVINKQVDN